MNRSSDIFLVVSDPLELCGRKDLEIFETTLTIWEKPVSFAIGAADRPAGLGDLVPMAQTVSTLIISSVIEQLGTTHQTVTCRKGCCACCDYLVALSLPEVFYLQSEVSAFTPAARHRLLESAMKASKKILDRNRLEENRIDQHAGLRQINVWYTQLNLSCPFINDGECSIYEKRPLACREHLVTSRPESCQIDQEGIPDLVDMPVSVLEVLGQLTAKLENAEIEAIMLPLALTCSDYYSPRSHCRWPGRFMAEQFIKLLQEESVRMALPAG